MFTQTHPHQVKARFVALRQSYGITATQAQANRAAHLAPTVQAFRPGVYHVGSCVVDLWRESCSCKEARQRKIKGKSPTVKPCPHFLALFLAGEWSPIYNPTAYLQGADVEQPEIIATYARSRGPLFIATGNAQKPNLQMITYGGLVEVIEASEYPGLIAVRGIVNNRYMLARADELNHYHPFYE